MDQKTAYLTQEEFDALMEYSTTVPTGQMIGKQWKAQDGSGTWYLREYTKDPQGDPKMVAIETRKIEVVTARERVARALEEEREKTRKPAVGPEWAAFAEHAPALMAELMKEFIDKKSLNDRAMIRLKTKALQDLFSADTGYPPIPAISAAQQRARRGGFAGGDFGQAGVGAYMPPVAGHRADEAEQLQRAVAEAADMPPAEVPPGVVPVPGAEVAPRIPADAPVANPA